MPHLSEAWLVNWIEKPGTVDGQGMGSGPSSSQRQILMREKLNIRTRSVSDFRRLITMAPVPTVPTSSAGEQFLRECWGHQGK